MDEKKKDHEYELACLARQDDETALEELINIFMPMFKRLYREISTFYDNFHYDDALQAGRIGLFKAIYFYREDKNMAFHNFVHLCALREMRSWQKSEMSHYYIDQKPILSLDYIIREEDETYLVDLISKDDYDNPEVISMNRMKLENIFKTYDPDKTVEGKVLKMKMEGYSYKEIAEAVNISSKDVDNILHKIRKKIG